jgi:PKHD-type hydroxylase
MRSRLWDVVLAPDVFSAEQCREILDVMSHVPLDPAGIHSGQVSSARVSNVRFVEYDPTVWIFQKLKHAVDTINPQTFGFHLHDWFGEGFQFTQYPEGGYYNWHADIGAGPSEYRKLSLVLQLNDDYEGGELEFFPAKFGVPKKAGWLAVFPSYMPHRVSPITKGVRNTLVTWVSGPTPFA